MKNITTIISNFEGYLNIEDIDKRKVLRRKEETNRNVRSRENPEQVCLINIRNSYLFKTNTHNNNRPTFKQEKFRFRPNLDSDHLFKFSTTKEIKETKVLEDTSQQSTKGDMNQIHSSEEI